MDKAPILMCRNDLQNIQNIDEVCVRLVDNALFFIRRDLVRGDGCAKKYLFYSCTLTSGWREVLPSGIITILVVLWLCEKH